MTGTAARRGVRLAGRLLALAVCLAARTAGGAGLRDAADGWLLDGEDLAHAVGSAGTAAAGASGPWLRGARMNLFGMPELPVTDLAGGWRGSSAALAASWQTTGGRLLRENTWRARVAAGRRLRLGAAACGGSLDLAGERRVRSVRLAAYLGLAVDAPAGLRVRADIWAPVSPAPAEAALERRLRLSLCGTGWGLACAVSRRADGSPAAGLDVALVLGGEFVLGLRLDVATAALGPGFSWRWGRLALRTSHVAHPQLGLTHRFACSWGWWGAVPW